MKIEIQAIAHVTEQDVVQAISELEPYEIADLFLQVVEKMDNPEDIKTCSERLRRCCFNRFGV